MYPLRWRGHCCCMCASFVRSREQTPRSTGWHVRTGRTTRKEQPEEKTLGQTTTAAAHTSAAHHQGITRSHHAALRGAACASPAVGHRQSPASAHNFSDSTNYDASQIHGDDLNVQGFDVLIPPGLLRQEHPLTDRAKATIQKARNAAMDIIAGEDDRLLVIVGPCSIHDAEQGLTVGDIQSMVRSCTC